MHANFGLAAGKQGGVVEMGFALHEEMSFLEGALGLWVGLWGRGRATVGRPGRN